MDETAISLPLLVGIVANAATIVIHALAVRATVAFVRHEDQAGRVGVGFWTGVAVLAVGVFFALVAHLLEIGVWAVLFMLCGEFPAFATAYDTLGRQLHDPGLRQRDHDPVVEISRTTRSCERNAPVRCIGGARLFGDSIPYSRGAICGQRVEALGDIHSMPGPESLL